MLSPFCYRYLPLTKIEGLTFPFRNSIASLIRKIAFCSFCDNILFSPFVIACLLSYLIGILSKDLTRKQGFFFIYFSPFYSAGFPVFPTLYPLDHVRRYCRGKQKDLDGYAYSHHTLTTSSLKALYLDCI